jgi:hypothetical protein
MRQLTFLEGVALAFVTSAVGSILYTALTAVLPGAWVLRGLIAGIALAYVSYLLTRSRQRVGRITTLAAWMLAATGLWWLEPPLTLYLLAHGGLIWLIRSLYFHSSILSALADLALNALSLAATVWAANQSGSVFLSIWCFFLVQALFVAIPSRMGRRSSIHRPAPDDEDPFEHAHRAAQAALRRLSSVQ